MNDPITLAALPDRRPQRADARRNYEKLIAAGHALAPDDLGQRVCRQR